MTTPILDDDRIEKMRLSVMYRVDQDITRRGRRLRNAIGLAAASVLVVGFGGYALHSIGGATTDSTSSGGADSSASAAEIQKAEPATADRQVITTGSITVTATNPRETAQQLSTWVESIDGRIDERSESGTGEDASAYVTVRVPSNQVTATIDRLETYGTVSDVSLENSDVTAKAKDLDARIDALKLSIDRLSKIMSDAGSSNDVIKAEAALTKRQGQLESLQAQRKSIADRVSLSTLSIDLSQRARVDSVEPGGFGGGLRDGWNALVSTVNAVVELAGRLLPWAAALALGYGFIRLLGRRRTTRN